MNIINDPADCVICRRRAFSMGMKWRGRQRWFCLECIALAKELAKVLKQEFDLYEQNATVAAGEAGGAFLDTIGVTDLATLTEWQYAQYIREVICAYGDSIRDQVAGLKAPF